MSTENSERTDPAARAGRTDRSAGGILLTKFGHACVRLEKAGRRLVVDPGGFTDVPVALDGAEHILITHEHADHVDDAPVLRHLAAHPEVTVRAPRAAAERLLDAAEGVGVARGRHGQDGQIIVTGPDERFETAGFSVATLGGDHAVIHPQIPRVANIGYLVDGLVYHPGDSYVLPPEHRPHTVLAVLNAPWAKVAETIDFLTAMAGLGTRQLVPVHDGLLNHHGRGIYLKLLGGFADQHGLTVTPLAVGDDLWVPAADGPAARESGA